MESSVENKYDKETAFKILEIVNSWIIAADNKSALLVAFIALLTGLSSNVFSSFREMITNDSWLQITLILFMGIIYSIVLFLVIYHLLKVFIARLDDKAVLTSISLLSYLSISKLTFVQYFELAKKVNNDSVYEMVISQIHINSIIASSKMKHFNKALIFSVFLIPLTLILAIILVI